MATQKRRKRQKLRVCMLLYTFKFPFQIQTVEDNSSTTTRRKSTEQVKERQLMDDDKLSACLREPSSVVTEIV